MTFFGASLRTGNIPETEATYRHLLSSTALTPSNPLRVIAHCDIDAAYAQFEAVRIGSPDHVPLIVIQWDTIIAVNYPARKFGIKRCSTMGSKEARELCPHVVIVHTATYRPGDNISGYWEDANVLTHKVSLDPYRRESTKIIEIFRELVPKGLVEKASIDEAYMDLTPMVLDRLIELFPHLGIVPPDAPDGQDSVLPPAPPIDWTSAGNVIPTDTEIATENVYDEGDDVPQGKEILHLDKTEGSWGDWALCIGAGIMREVRGEIWKRLHYTCSAGISHNKAMAKLCSSYRKPNDQTVLRHSAVPYFLRDTDFTDIRNLGGKLGRCIAEEFKVQTVGELMKISLKEMQNRFGEESIWVYNLIRGIDETELTARYVNKTMLASKNIIPGITTTEQALPWINLLAGELNVRLREAREIEPGLWPKTLVLSHRTGFGYVNNSRSKQVPFPYTKELTGECIAKYGRRMWLQSVVELKRRPGGIDVHNLALQFSGVTRMEEGQTNIEGFLAGAQASRKRKVEADSSVKEEGMTIDIDSDDGDAEVNSESTSWTCKNCLKRFKVESADQEFMSDYSLEDLVAKQQREHEDYHFALELSREIPRMEDTVVTASKRQKVKKKNDIRTFFNPRGK